MRFWLTNDTSDILVLCQVPEAWEKKEAGKWIAVIVLFFLLGLVLSSCKFYLTFKN